MRRTRIASQYLLSLVLIAAPIFFVPIGGQEFEPPKVILIRFLAAVLCSLAISSQLDAFSFKTVFTPAITEWITLPRLSWIYIGLATVSTFLSYDFHISLWGTAYDHHGLITLFSCFVIALFLAKNYLPFKTTAIILTLGSVPVVFYGLVQSLGFDPIV